ncbi:MAG: hypothetical protein ACI84R_003111 [Candidatus Azotimanducaceae bacterium]|jgi:hypothetical protein
MPDDLDVPTLAPQKDLRMTLNSFRTPAPSRLPFKLLARRLPALAEVDKADLYKRFEESLIAFKKRKSPNDIIRPSYEDTDQVERWVKFYTRLWKENTASLDRSKDVDKSDLITAMKRAHVAGVVTRDGMEERIAALHADAPWMAPAANAVMQHMRQRTQHGAAGLSTPPLLLLGPPGCGKSTWAKDLADQFNVPKLEIDVGATQGAVFSITGTERGWGTSHPGRVVQSFLETSCANPVVIINEVDKIPENVGTTVSKLPGAFEALKSLIEPSTARAWTCPALQLPFDMRAVNWVMTTNTIDHMPQAFLDRCKLVELPEPSINHLTSKGHALLHAAMPSVDANVWAEVLDKQLHRMSRQGQNMSFRKLKRLVDKLTTAQNQPLLQ